MRRQAEWGSGVVVFRERWKLVSIGRNEGEGKMTVVKYPVRSVIWRSKVCSCQS